jgi:hypothetical protein
MRLGRASLLSAASTALVLACSSASIEGTGLSTDDLDPTALSAQQGNPSGEQCTEGSAAALPAADPSSLPAGCCAEQPQKARCVPKAIVPANFQKQLDGCDNGGGVCVPDAQIKSGGAAPKKCKAALNLDGVCLSVCVPALGKHPQRKLLEDATKDQCDPGELCAPCVDPLKGNAPTGACDIGKASTCTPSGGDRGGSSGGAPPTAGKCPHEGPPVIDGSSFPSCSESGGMRCVPSTLIPPALAPQLEPCDGGNGLCAPKKSIEAAGNYVPKTCKAVAGAEGRCQNASLKAIKAQADKLTRDACDADELCAPCFDPTSGTDTQACRTASCDAPKEPPVQFKNCCATQNQPQGKCVPKTLVPASQAPRLRRGAEETECGEAELCAPNVSVVAGAPKPPACNVPEGGLLITLPAYTGVCLSKCVVKTDGLMESIGIRQGNCPRNFDCFPCRDPRTGQPTGAPGCG